MQLINISFLTLVATTLVLTNALPISKLPQRADNLKQNVHDFSGTHDAKSYEPVREDHQTSQKTLTKGGKKYTGDATFYQPEADACGTYSTEADFVAALNAPQFGDGESDHNPNCGRIAHITRGNKHVTVRVVDECPECVEGDLDLSPAAFNSIADPEEGRVKISWHWLE